MINHIIYFEFIKIKILLDTSQVPITTSSTSSSIDNNKQFGSLYEFFSSMSSSAIALSSNRQLYDPFLFPCSSNTFIPNRRLQKLCNLIKFGSFNNNLIQDIDYQLQQSLLSLKTWTYPTEGSETVLLDPSVNCIILNIINSNVLKEIQNISFKKDLCPFVPLMCKNVKSVYHIDYNNWVVFTSEAKGVEDSQYVCLIQALEIAADSSLYLSRSTKLSYELCSTPGIIVCGDKIQFYGVYLVQDFPVIVYLTPPLSYINVEDRLMISRAILACVQYIIDTTGFIQFAKIIYPLRSLKFDYHSYFYKPIRANSKFKVSCPDQNLISNVMTNVERIMYIYQKIYSKYNEKTHEFIALPLGLMRIPCDTNKEYIVPIIQKIKQHFNDFDDNLLACSPVIIFQNLSLWSNKRPNNEYISKYLFTLRNAISYLNESKIAHLDLRPHNFMWLFDQQFSTIFIKIIDFEDAVIFGSKIRHIDYLQTDKYKRYPPLEGENQYASEHHNNWFLLSMELWLNQDDHAEFMYFNRELVSEKFLIDNNNHRNNNNSKNNNKTKRNRKRKKKSTSQNTQLILTTDETGISTIDMNDRNDSSNIVSSIITSKAIKHTRFDESSSLPLKSDVFINNSNVKSQTNHNNNMTMNINNNNMINRNNTLNQIQNTEVS